MIQGLILFTLVMVALLLRAMFRSTNEGVKRLRTVLVVCLAGAGLVVLFMAATFGEAAFILALTGAVIWVVKGFRKG
jgi:hypothetical protein